MIHAFKQVRLTNTTLSGNGANLVWGGTNVALSSQTGQFISTAQTGQFAASGMTGQFITTAQTGLFYPASNPNNYITAAQAGGISNINVTGQFLSGSVAFTGVSGVVVDISGNTVRIIGSNFVLTSSTGQFVDSSKTGGFVSISQTGQFITTAQTGQFAAAGMTGQFVTTAMTGILGIWTGNQQSFATTIYLGLDSTGILFPSVFTSIPRTVMATMEVTGDTMYMVNARGRTVSGYTAMFSDTIQESGIIVHTFASL